MRWALDAARSLRALRVPLPAPARRAASTPAMSQQKYRYISADDLAALLKSEPGGAFKTWAVIDVRDSDFARYAEAREAQLAAAAPAQEILVLRQGFEGFQSRYRDDAALVEKFNKFYHD
ncbi:Cdc25 phosphatase Ibp1 [Vanrija albida]|uniref:Cdc25 phosphatase Ibp1 n=1 Tax=Vanrija albida TaxID=181172 RepID=A0ABR3Q9B5_9TREE